MKHVWKLVVGVGCSWILACSSTTAGTDGGTDGGTTSANGRTATGECATSGSSDAGSKCTEAEVKAWGDCAVTKCDAEFKTAYGSDYKSGTYGGACGDYQKCVVACNCGDTACAQACGQTLLSNTSCTSALTTAGQCVNNNCKLTCASLDGGT